jgi:carbamoyl-phosphate synthase large subunit
MTCSILVSGASGIVGYGVLRSLRVFNRKIRLIGTSIYEGTAAEEFSDVFEKAPLTSDDAYIDWLLATIRKHKVAMIVPGIEADVFKWVEHMPEIIAAGAVPLLNARSLISICQDKWDFYLNLRESNLSCQIETRIDGEFEEVADTWGLPFLLKPRRGFASKGIVRVGDVETFNQHRKNIGSVLMIQPIIGTDDQEYSSSAFCDVDGRVLARMTIRRKLSREGFTENAEVVFDSSLDSAVDLLCDHFRPIGPTNFQFRKHNGTFRLLEINPRVSSATSIRTAFGYNEAAMAVEYFLIGQRPLQPTIRHGRATRYIDEVIRYS